MLRIVLFSVGLVGALGLSAAFAHAEPAKVKPGDGAVLATAPLAVEMEMSQEMARRDGANDIDVLDEAGQEITTVSAVIDNGNRKKLSVALPSGLKQGKYVVKWKTLSAEDGDSAEGQISFTFDPAASPSAGRETLREDLLGGATPAPAGAGDAPQLEAPGGGTSWVLVAAVAAGMFVLGGGVSFLLVQRKQ